VESNRVFWSGGTIAHKPEIFKLPPKVNLIKKVVAGYKSFACVTGIFFLSISHLAVENNEIYFRHNFLQFQKENKDTGVQSADNSIFNGGQIIDIGGSYRNKYAIVSNR